MYNNRGEAKTLLPRGIQMHISDGERFMISMVSDLARRMAIANPKIRKSIERQGDYFN
ncbi:hypothetical protein CRD_00329 [Raphidiopsis brookii D9]|nr:hypothetical protein CRD_00329 [Raphidiopsis brookii D9]